MLKALIILPHALKENIFIGCANNSKNPLHCDNSMILINYLIRSEFKVDIYRSVTFLKGDYTKLDEYDVIFAASTSFISLNSYHNLELLRALKRNEKKVIRYFTDPDQVESVINIMKSDDFTKLLTNKLNSSRFGTTTPELANEFVSLYKDFNTKTYCVMPFLCEQDEYDVQNTFNEVYGLGVCQTTLNWLIKKIPYSTPFEKKSDRPMICTGSDARAKYTKIKKEYGIKDIEIVGATFKEARKKEKISLTEEEVQIETDKHKFVFAVSPKMNCLMWDRRRYLYSAWHGCVMLSTKPEKDAYPDCYQLDESIFGMTLKEQKEIAAEQQDFLLTNLMSDADSFLHFVQLLRKVTGIDFKAFEENHILQDIFD